MKTAYILISGSDNSALIETLKQDHQGQRINVFSSAICKIAYYELFKPGSRLMAGRPLLRQLSINIPADDPELFADGAAHWFCMASKADYDDYAMNSWIDMRNNSDVIIMDAPNLTVRSRRPWVHTLRTQHKSQIPFKIVMIETDSVVLQHVPVVGIECDELRIIHTRKT